MRNELARDTNGQAQEDFLDRVRRAQAIIAAAPMLDPLSADEIIGYDEYGLPA